MNSTVSSNHMSKKELNMFGSEKSLWCLLQIELEFTLLLELSSTS